ncbi:MAG TPA: acyl-CoA dehydrogenase family protein, partial [Longimicrobium sp.]|nr:acyl-CoA dehydrogenase family protein [Longimicrobium sp.]
MADRTFLEWPFFGSTHRRMMAELDEWVPSAVAPLAHGHGDVDGTCRSLVRALAEGGWLRYVVPGAYGGTHDRPDVRSLCLIRETLAHASGLADFAFAMQGLGSGPISFFGTDEQKRRYLPPVVSGDVVAAFALSEPDAGSDVAAMTTTARSVDGGYVIDGRKTWISNAGIADRYVVFTRFPEAGERGFAAFVVDADNPGLRVSARIDVTAPHPLGTIEFDGCR